MKAVVTEVLDNNNVVVLTSDGEFKKTKVFKETKIGEEIIIKNTSIIYEYRKIAAVILIFFMLGSSIGAYAYYTPYGYINVDINPSIELAYNIFGRVIEINGVNEDGIALANNLASVKNKKVDKALIEVIDRSVESIDNDNNNEIEVLITYSDKKEEDKIVDTINYFDEEDKNITVYNNKVDKHTYKEKRSDSNNLGKEVLIDKIKDLNVDNINYVELEEKTVKEIVEVYNELRDNGNNLDKDKSNKDNRNKEDKKENDDKKKGNTKEDNDNNRVNVDEIINEAKDNKNNNGKNGNNNTNSINRNNEVEGREDKEIEEEEQEEEERENEVEKENDETEEDKGKDKRNKGQDNRSNKSKK